MRNIVYMCIFSLFAFTFSACGDQGREGENDSTVNDSSSKTDTTQITGTTGKVANQDSIDDIMSEKKIMESYLDLIYDFFVCSVVKESLKNPADAKNRESVIKQADKCKCDLIKGSSIDADEDFKKITATNNLKNQLESYKQSFISKYITSDTSIVKRKSVNDSLTYYFTNELPKLSLSKKDSLYTSFKSKRKENGDFDKLILSIQKIVIDSGDIFFQHVLNDSNTESSGKPGATAATGTKGVTAVTGTTADSPDIEQQEAKENSARREGLLWGATGGTFTGLILAGLFFNRRHKTKLKKEKEQFDFTIKDNERSFRNKFEAQERKYKELERVNAELADTAESVSSIYVKEQFTVTPTNNDQPQDLPKRSLYFGNPSQQGTFYHEAANSSPRPGQSIYELRLDASGTKGMLYVWDSPEAYTQAKGVVENTLDPVCERTQRPDISHTRIVTRRPAEMKLEGELWQLIGQKVLISFE